MKDARLIVNFFSDLRLVGLCRKFPQNIRINPDVLRCQDSRYLSR